MVKITLKRDGFSPIAFMGEEIGSGSNEIQGGQRSNRWTTVVIYKTAGGKYVVSLRRQTCWQGERDHRRAAVFTKATEVIDWLRGDETELGDVSQAAVEDAGKHDPAFAAAWIETVD